MLLGEPLRPHRQPAAPREVDDEPPQPDRADLAQRRDLGVARLLSHRMMVMKGGVVIESGLTDQVLDDPREAYTQLLVSSILPP